MINGTSYVLGGQKENWIEANGSGLLRPVNIQHRKLRRERMDDMCTRSEKLSVYPFTLFLPHYHPAPCLPPPPPPPIPLTFSTSPEQRNKKKIHQLFSLEKTLGSPFRGATIKRKQIAITRRILLFFFFSFHFCTWNENIINFQRRK